jgi:hypothetical protein
MIFLTAYRCSLKYDELYPDKPIVNWKHCKLKIHLMYPVYWLSLLSNTAHCCKILSFGKTLHLFAKESSSHLFDQIHAICAFHHRGIIASRRTCSSSKRKGLLDYVLKNRLQFKSKIRLFSSAVAKGINQRTRRKWIWIFEEIDSLLKMWVRNLSTSWSLPVIHGSTQLGMQLFLELFYFSKQVSPFRAKIGSLASSKEGISFHKENHWPRELKRYHA